MIPGVALSDVARKRQSWQNNSSGSTMFFFARPSASWSATNNARYAREGFGLTGWIPLLPSPSSCSSASFHIPCLPNCFICCFTLSLPAVVPPIGPETPLLVVDAPFLALPELMRLPAAPLACTSRAPSPAGALRRAPSRPAPVVPARREDERLIRCLRTARCSIPRESTGDAGAVEGP